MTGRRSGWAGRVALEGGGASLEVIAEPVAALAALPERPEERDGAPRECFA